MLGPVPIKSIYCALYLLKANGEIITKLKHLSYIIETQYYISSRYGTQVTFIKRYLKTKKVFSSLVIF